MTGLCLYGIAPSYKLRMGRSIWLEPTHCRVGSLWPYRIPYGTVELVRHGADPTVRWTIDTEEWVEVKAGSFRRKFVLREETGACAEALVARSPNTVYTTDV